MKKFCFAVLLLCAVAGYAMPIASSARSMVPSEVQQLFGLDYRALKDSPTAQALKQQVMPENVKETEGALKDIGIDIDSDLDQLNVASFRTENKGIQTVFVAQGSFSAKKVIKKLKLKKISGVKYGTAIIYPMDNGLVMTFTDDNTLAFGTPDSLHSALDTRDGKRPSLDYLCEEQKRRPVRTICARPLQDLVEDFAAFQAFHVLSPGFRVLTPLVGDGDLDAFSKSLVAIDDFRIEHSLPPVCTV